MTEVPTRIKVAIDLLKETSWSGMSEPLQESLQKMLTEYFAGEDPPVFQEYGFVVEESRWASDPGVPQGRGVDAYIRLPNVHRVQVTSECVSMYDDKGVLVGRLCAKLGMLT